MSDLKQLQLSLDFEGKHYNGIVTPSAEIGSDGRPVSFKVELDGKLFAYLCCGDLGWSERDNASGQQGLVNAIGRQGGEGKMDERTSCGGETGAEGMAVDGW